MNTKVIFRKFRSDGEILALFPEIPADCHAGHCLSYQHTGQHGAAAVDLSHCTVPATPEESAPLAAELERVGYVLQPVHRVTQAMHRARRAALATV